MCFGDKEYNGNVAGVKWKGSNDPAERAYGFSYDAANRLLKADYNEKTGGAWNQLSGVNYNVIIGNGTDPSSAYDLNGNILRMQQWGLKPGGSAPIDDIHYTYNNTNQLQKTTDLVADDPAAKLGDFTDKNPIGVVDYSYDDNGNITKDENKQILSIVYNFQNQPTVIDMGAKGTIQFEYDAVGTRLKKIVTDNTQTTPKVTTTSYVNSYTYENNELKLFTHEGGRVRAIPQEAAAPLFVFDYFISDYLGNTRAVITEETVEHLYLASMEQERTATENALFANVDDSRTAKPVGYPQDVTTQKNDFVAKLNAKDPAKKIGPSLVLKVMAGSLSIIPCC